MIYLKKLKQFTGRHLHNIPGWRTNRKIVVFVSDDWGSIRMPSRKTYYNLLNAGIRVDKSPFMKYDSLESESDLEQLFGTLKKFRDSNNNSPVFTANTIMANPDFEKIQKSGFKDYFYEPFTETYIKHFGDKKVISIFKEGLNEKLFVPQLHGREHLNVNFWMESLRDKNVYAIRAFQEKTYALDNLIVENINKSFLPAFDYAGRHPLDFKEIIRESQYLFKSIFGFSSRSFIAPNYLWDQNIEKYLKENQVKYIQTSRGQLLPLGVNKERRFIKHYLGEKNQYNQVYLVRNCYFEPATKNHNRSVITNCLKQIKAAFYWKKPAIISSHRLNYVGSIHEGNRSISLRHLDELLKTILKDWPEVEFMSSDSLGDIMTPSSI